MPKKLIEVTQVIEVEYDEAQFSEQFMQEFRQHLYDFETIDDHLKHLAQLRAREIVHSGGFVEGYGPLSRMGISFMMRSQDEEVLPE